MIPEKRDNELLQQLKAFAETFASAALTPYTTQLRSASRISQNPKEVNDPVWGTVKLTSLEVIILDCPLVQRLRFVRQLGVVHWVYPGASHARFEHTLGVLHQAQQLITAINQGAGEGAAAAPVDHNKGGLVRLCALLHDIGHGVFSHVSEHALAKRTALRVSLAAFAKDHGLEKVQLSEVLAYYMIGSPAFVDMLAVALDRLNQPISFGGGASQNAKTIVERVQAVIIGKMIDDEIPLLHEIITGPFDADKLDYYIRDAKHAGIPSLLDISRLTQKIAVKRVPGRDLPTTISSNLTASSDYHFIFGLKWSGASILDELHLARVLLYAKIYRHKKVQAIEAMLDALFEALANAPGADLCQIIGICYKFSDDQFLWTDSKALTEAAGLISPEPQLLAFVNDILGRLRSRTLFVAALAIRPKYPADPWKDDAKQSRGLKDLDQDLANSQKLRGLRDELVVELQDLAKAVPSVFGGLDPATVGLSLAISAKPKLGGATEIERAYVLQGQKFISGRDLDRINQPAWSTAYDFGAPSAIVFCPRECATGVYVAAERLIRRKYEVVIPSSAMDLSKQDVGTVTNLKREAEAAGWYAGVPLDIRPIPERLTKLDVATRIEPIAAKLAAFDEPKTMVGQRRPTELTQRILTWLAQFRDDDTISCALTALEKLRILRREDTRAALAAFTDAHPQFAGATICPLGAPKDSGAVQAYLSLDDTSFPRVSTVEQAAARAEDGPIIFLDDFTASGSQALDILGHWFGEAELTSETLQEERLPFSETERTYLRGRELAFVFVAGWKDGLGRIREATSKLGLSATVYAHLTDDDLPFAFDGALSDHPAEEIAGFRERCQHVGEEILKSASKSAEKIQERSLGYGNRAMLLASGLNVPTQSLLCLWRDGQVDGVDWHALLRRRDKN